MVDLARLVVRLQADSARLQKDLDSATGKLKRFESSASRSARSIEGQISNSFSKLGKKVAAGFAGLVAVGSITSAFKSVVQATIESEKATASLEAALKGARGATSDSARQLKAYAEELQRTTTFEDDAIVSSQALLATFRNISVQEFPRAQRAILDVAAALGKDLNSATELVGKALNNPINATRSLREAHVALSPALQKTIKDLVETGRVAEAQNLVLGEFEKAVGGRAVAATKTLGGALEQLKNSFGNLLEGDAGSVTEVTEGVNRLTEVLQSPGIKAAAQSFSNAILSAAAAVAEFAGSLLTLEGEGKGGIQTLAEFEKPAGIFERILQNLPDHIEDVIRKMIAWRRTTLDVIGAIDDLSPKLLLVSEAQARASQTFSGQIQRTAPVVPPANNGAIASIINPGFQTEAALKKRLDAYKAHTAATFALVKDSAQRELETLQRSYEAGLVSLQEFFDRKTDLQQREVDAEIASRQALLKAGPEEGERIGILNEIEILQKKRNDIAVQGAADAAKAREEVDRTLEDLRIRLQEAQGDAIGAQVERLKVEFRERLESLPADAQAAGQKIVEQLIPIETARLRLQSLEEEFAASQSRISATSDLLAAQKEAGLISAKEFRKQTADHQSQLAGTIQKQIEARQQLLATVTDPRQADTIRTSITQLEADLTRLSVSHNEVLESIKTGVEGGIATLFQDLADGSKTAAESFRDFGNSVIKTINQIAAEAAANQIADLLFGGLGRGPTNGAPGLTGPVQPGGGGFFSKIGGFFASLFHQGGIVGSGGPGRLVPASAFAGAQYFHDGGLALRANELPGILKIGEEVLTREDPRHTLNGGGQTIYLSNHFNVQGELSRRAREDIEWRTGQSVERARRKNT